MVILDDHEHIKSAVGWQALALNGLLHPEFYIETFILACCWNNRLLLQHMFYNGKVWGGMEMDNRWKPLSIHSCERSEKLETQRARKTHQYTVDRCDQDFNRNLKKGICNNLTSLITGILKYTQIGKVNYTTCFQWMTRPYSRHPKFARTWLNEDKERWGGP